MSYFRRDTVRAAKQYSCDVCGQTIQEGELHIYSCGVWDGDFFTSREDKICSNIGDAYFSDARENETNDDFIVEWLKEGFCNSCAEWTDCDYWPLVCPKIRAKFASNGWDMKLEKPED